MAAESFNRIQTSAIDGRAQAPRYIQRQLLALHTSLTNALPALQQIIQQETGVAASDALVEISLAVEAVRYEYDSLDVPEHVKDEYSVAFGNDRPGRRRPYGAVLIIPSGHTYLYSAIQPVASAIAAGNCVMLYMEQTLSEVARLAREILTSSLAKDTFAVVDRIPGKCDFSPDNLLISDQTDGSKRIVPDGPYTVLRAANVPAVAFVDRTADISEAAKSLVLARFRFGGDSPYAPGVVLVNEFVLKEFSQFAIQNLTQCAATVVDTMHKTQSSRLDVEHSLSKELSLSAATTLVSTAVGDIVLLKSRCYGAVGDIVLLKSRNSALFGLPTRRPVLLLQAVKSLDDAIDTANNGDQSFLASYQFADNKAAKYISQFLNAQLSFTNHIPVKLLVGPAAPKQNPTSRDPPSAKDMYSWPSPEYVAISTEERTLAKLLETSSKNALDLLKSRVEKPLKPMNEKRSTAIGFFEQGILTGGVLLLATIIAAGTYGVIRFWRW